MKLLSLALFACAVTGHASSGTYRYVPSDSVRSFCQRHHLVIPTGNLSLRPDGTFTFAVTDDEGTHRASGRYVRSARTLRFEVEAGSALDYLAESAWQETEIESRNGRYLPVTRPIPVAKERSEFRGDIVGTWTLRRDGREDATVKLNFDKAGRFWFRGMGLTSSGTYKCEGGELVLLYDSIDGQPVSSQTLMQKRIPLDADGFFIDDYRYERASRI